VPAVLLVALALAAVPLAAGEAAVADGHWQGAIEVPGTPLELDVDLTTAADGTLSGDVSIPIQGIRDLALVDLAVDGRTVRFAIPGIPGEPRFEGTLSEDGETLAGTFRQGGASLPFTLRRGADRAEQARAALAGFDDFVAKAVEEWNVPGAGMAVVRGGEVVFAGGFGHRDLESDLPVTADTLFAIGSTTKAFTATLLGMLVDEGELDWDQPLRELLPRFRLQDPLASALITPRDLLTHRSGLPRHDLVWYNNNDLSRAELVARLAHLQPSESLRAKFQYNNLMFLTAGHLAEVLAEDSWENLIASRILEPLGMARTTFDVADSQRDGDVALPYRETDEGTLHRIPFRPIQLIGPAGSINSSANEMSRWLLFNLAGGKAGERQLINPTTLAEIHTPQMTTGAASNRPQISAADYAMGWMVDVYRGHRRLHHGGGIDGFTTSVMLFPDDDLGLVSFTNRSSALPPILNQHAADRVLELEPMDWYGEGLKQRLQGRQLGEEGEKKKDVLRRPDTRPSHPLGEYAGRYHHPGYGDLTVAEGDGDDALTVTYNRITAPLEHWHFDVWNGAETDRDPTFVDMKFLFQSDENGDVTAVAARFEPAVEPIVFTKQADPRLADPAYLARYAGDYLLAGQTVTIALSGNALKVHLPGQPTYTLVPQASGRFQLEEAKVVTVGFSEDDGVVTALTFYQPNGVFEAQRVKE